MYEPWELITALACIFTFFGGIEYIIKKIFPHLKFSERLVFHGLFAFAGALLMFMNSNFGLHQKYYKEENLRVFCRPSELTVKEGDTFFYRYNFVIENKYPKNTKIDQLFIMLNFPMKSLETDILLNDFEKDFLSIEFKDESSLIVRLATLAGSQRFGIGIDCLIDLEHELPPRLRDARLFVRAVTGYIDYKIFGKSHNKSIRGCFAGKYLSRIFFKKNITMDINCILDHRSLPKDFISFQYARFESPDGLEVIRICSENGHVETVYSNPNMKTKKRSDMPINDNFDPIRVLVLRDALVIDSPNLYLETYHYKTKNMELAAQHYKQGNVHFEKGEDDKAISEYSRCLRLNPLHKDAYLNRGAAQGRKGETDKAISDFMEAIRLDPEFGPAYGNRGIAYLNTGDYDRSIKDCRKALEFKPENIEQIRLTLAKSYNNRGSQRRAKREYHRAISDYDKSIEFCSNLPEPYFNRGLVWKDLNNPEKAQKDFSRACEMGFKRACDKLNSPTRQPG
jgi:Flp pilus assembly protein TadD